MDKLRVQFSLFERFLHDTGANGTQRFRADFNVAHRFQRDVSRFAWVQFIVGTQLLRVIPLNRFANLHHGDVDASARGVATALHPMPGDTLPGLGGGGSFRTHEMIH